MWLFVIHLSFSPNATMADDSDYLFFTIEECLLAMTGSDSNVDEKLFFGEFLEAAISLSPFPVCPDIETASNIGSSYRLVFEELQCACLDYPALNPPTGSFDPLCCDRSGPASIRLPLSIYPEAYTEGLCRGIELALAADCLEPSEVPGVPSEGGTAPTLAPTNIPLSQLFPTQPPTPQIDTPGPAPLRDEDDSLLGLPTVWTVFAWIAFAACTLVLLALITIFFASFCRKSEEKIINRLDDQNGEEELEIEFEREADEEEVGISESEIITDSMKSQSLATAIDMPIQEQSQDVKGKDDDVDDENYVDASADAGRFR